jgi:hypothetical protein
MIPLMLVILLHHLSKPIKINYLHKDLIENNNVLAISKKLKISKYFLKKFVKINTYKIMVIIIIIYLIIIT